MKIEKEELLERINSLEIDDEIKIPLMEDISDSIEVTETDNSEYEDLKSKYEELKVKYKERFFKGSEEKEESEEKEDELEEEEVIDIKEI